jgi:hypothetical protein
MFFRAIIPLRHDGFKSKAKEMTYSGWSLRRHRIGAITNRNNQEQTGRTQLRSIIISLHWMCSRKVTKSCATSVELSFLAPCRKMKKMQLLNHQFTVLTDDGLVGVASKSEAIFVSSTPIV